jgi:probable F420-dependent oxidoreductase
MDLGRVGIWTAQLDLQPAGRAKKAAAEIEDLGYGALWVPEGVGREAISNASTLLAATTRLIVASGIATIWHRSAWATAAAQRLLADAWGDRYLLGLGVSHQPTVERVLGQEYDRPLDRMRRYLDAIDDAFLVAPPPGDPPPRVLAALGPKMLELAGERAWGAHTYFVTPEHTRVARKALGEGPMLLVEQACVLATDPGEARATARKHTQRYLTLPNYVNNLRRLGWGDDDLADAGSDALVDALVAWGDVDAIAARVAEHHDAGADHVCVQVLGPDATAMPVAAWRELAPALRAT